MKERYIAEAVESVDRRSPSAIQCDHLDNLIANLREMQRIGLERQLAMMSPSSLSL
jgi:hypothetical protein